MKLKIAAFLLIKILFCSTAFAGFFGVSKYIPIEKYAIGIEPEILLPSNETIPASFGFNLKGQYGLNALSNLFGSIGSGSHYAYFRWYAGITFDFFPDTPSQPGLGIALSLGTTNVFIVKPAIVLEPLSIIYLHKTVKYNNYALEPFIAFPLGLVLYNGFYSVISKLVLGSFYHYDLHWSSILELGLSISNASQSYVSGGVTYYF
jgi:hypothetical protein